MKLLVVEDEALLRHHLFTRLTDSGHVVEAVANAEEALYQTGQFNHDLAIIDLGLQHLWHVERDHVAGRRSWLRYECREPRRGECWPGDAERQAMGVVGRFIRRLRGRRGGGAVAPPTQRRQAGGMAPTGARARQGGAGRGRPRRGSGSSAIHRRS